MKGNDSSYQTTLHEYNSPQKTSHKVSIHALNDLPNLEGNAQTKSGKDRSAPKSIQSSQLGVMIKHGPNPAKRICR